MVFYEIILKKSVVNFKLFHLINKNNPPKKEKQTNIKKKKKIRARDIFVQLCYFTKRAKGPKLSATQTNIISLNNKK